MNSSNATSTDGPAATSSPGISWDDATWILTSSFIIFTMQSGFGLLEAGSVSTKNEVNIMVKNVVDVVFGGLSYWAFGYGLSFGKESGTNPFSGVGSWLVDSSNDDMGAVFSSFVFQMSFATTATTIVSGAMAERMRLSAYIVFSVGNTLVYSLPAHWMWAEDGFLRQLGAVDFAGSGVVHLVGATTGLVGTLLLRPRLGRFQKGAPPPAMSSPSNAIIGMFMLWWAWLGFNCGSTFGISGRKWQVASKAAATTLMASFGGGIVGVVASYFLNDKKYDVADLINSILAALVAITASCAVVRAWEALIIGALGAGLALAGMRLLDRLRVDDPVGAVPVHGVAGIWGLVAVGLFAEDSHGLGLTYGQRGVFRGGSPRLLGLQLLAVVCNCVWSGLVSTLMLVGIDKTVGLRMTVQEELQGADFVEHGLRGATDLRSLTISAPLAASPLHPGDRRWSCATVTPIPHLVSPSLPLSPSTHLTVLQPSSNQGNEEAVAVVKRRSSRLPEAERDPWSVLSVLELETGSLAGEAYIKEEER